jgi:gluconolactonase
MFLSMNFRKSQILLASEIIMIGPILITQCLLLLLTTTGYSAEPIAELGPVGKVKKLHTDLQFTEGPTKAPDGTIYFTDIPADRIYELATDGTLSVFLEPAGHCNGLMVTADGKLYACSMDGQLITIDRKTKKVTPLASEYEGKRFNAPNDLVVDKSGGIYFTDPHFRAPEPLPQGTTAVYYRAANGKVTRLLDDLKAPNGVILSPDEKTLYVIPSMQSEMMAYPVESPGKLGQGKLFCTLKQKDGQSGSGGDGLTVDTQGNLYITTGLGLQVYDPEGQLLGIIELPEQPANVTFGGKKNNILYVTARKSLYTVKMKATGHQFSGKQ